MASQLIVDQQVLKSQPVIRALVAQLFPDYTGRKIVVRVFTSEYLYTEYLGDGDIGLLCTEESDGAVWRYQAQPSPDVGSVMWQCSDGQALAMHHRRGAKCVSINIVASGLTLDDVAVLVDALLGGTKAERVTAQHMLSERTPGMTWGSLDKGFERVTARDVLFAAIEAMANADRKAEAKSNRYGSLNDCH